MKTLNELMEPRPMPWGLRGDPLLWDAMQEVFEGLPPPRDAEALRKAFETAFKTLTDHDLETAPTHIPVAWTRRKSGLSNGLVSLVYWRDTLLPLMIERLEQE